jgi:uncharacterized protein (TIGR00369 family)
MFDISVIQSVIDHLPHCQVLTISVTDITQDRVTLVLPYSEVIVGDPESGVIHGGAITTLLDTVFGIAASLAQEALIIAPTLDLRIDYMRSAKPHCPIYAHGEIYHLTSRIIFVKGIAYQTSESLPVAHCTATFMLAGPKMDKAQGTAG